MNLKTVTVPSTTKRTGEQGGIGLAAGQSLLIETSPEGDEILNAEVPAGKAWTVSISVIVDEADV